MLLCPGKPLSELAHPARAFDCPSVSAAVSRTSIRDLFRCPLTLNPIKDGVVHDSLPMQSDRRYCLQPRRNRGGNLKACAEQQMGRSLEHDRYAALCPCRSYRNIRCSPQMRTPFPDDQCRVLPGFLCLSLHKTPGGVTDSGQPRRVNVTSTVVGTERGGPQVRRVLARDFPSPQRWSALQR